MNTTSLLVWRELVRRELYERIVTQIREKLQPFMREKEIRHLVLRYVLTKVIDRENGSDPVFMVTPSEKAESGLRRDLEFHHCLHALSPLWLQRQFEQAATTLRDRETHFDPQVTPLPQFSCQGNRITCQGEVWPDYADLASRYPQHLPFVVALHLRYGYLGLWRHGLARCYRQMKFLPHQALEGFASAFNHYFDRFCSAFPDLETPFGSRGSFFEMKSWHPDQVGPVVFVNPPWCETVLNLAARRVLDHLSNLSQGASQVPQTFVFTYPGWKKDFAILDELRRSEFCVKYNEYPPGQLYFLDHMPGIRENEQQHHSSSSASLKMTHTAVPELNIGVIVEVILRSKNITF